VKNSVIVVGAGIVGCAIARELAVRGVACTVFDDRPVAGGATRASAGMLAPYVEAHERGPMLELGVQSLELYTYLIPALASEGLDVEYGMIGTLEVALTRERAHEIRRNGARYGGWLEPTDVSRTYGVGPNEGALTSEEHGYVDAPQLARALARSAEKSGATFRQTKVRAIEHTAASLRVEAGRESLDTETVVIAAGAWTNAIAGVTLPPLRPVRGQLLQLTWPHYYPLATIVWGPDCYVVPRLDGSILVGATVEEAGFDERITEEGVETLLAAVHRLLPVTKNARLIEARVGLRPATPDELPVIGSDPRVPGLVHASGHYRNGVLLAPITAKLIGDLVVDGRSDHSLESFRVDRFW
jgi:glycine oxidase